MATDLKSFANEYRSHLAQRDAQGIPPLPLSPSQVEAVCAALEQKDLDPGLLEVHGQPDTKASLRHLISERVPPGVYPASKVKADFLGRPRFTAPEIQRSNLASVILQAKALRLGDIQRFPFLDPPRPIAVRDGFKTLFELGAIDARNELTALGRKLSRLPVDPRIGRMILAADKHGCLAEVLIIAAALEIRDPRERRERPEPNDSAGSSERETWAPENPAS